jgi:D-xylonolactonase
MAANPSSVAPAILSAPRVIGSTRATLGEGLCWSPGDEALYWVDILEHRLYRETIALSGHREWAFDETISAVAELDGRRGLAVTLRRGLALFDPETDELVRLGEPELERECNRFNDGKCDARGRFWGGTMDFDATEPTGALYRFDASGEGVRVIDLGWPVTNGPAWSVDQRTMFVNDTVNRRVVAYGFDVETGAVGSSREWLVFPEPDGLPDGITTDAAGRIWIAHWGGACVTCHDPETAAELARIELPTAHITNVAFGGRDLTTLFITSARIGLDATQLAGQPLAGALFAIDVDAAGSVPGLFDG